MNPNIPNMSNIPGIGAVTDTLDFVKNLWGKMGLPGMNMPGMNIPGMSGLNVPGMVMPTLSVEEINKKISDLKAVESWLALNMSMLRTTIQALEVQAATITTLQTMGEQFTSTMAAATHAVVPEKEDSPTTGETVGNGAAKHRNGSGRAHAAPEPTSKDEEDAASLTAPLVNAAAWWNMLQDQFKQAVSGAMTETSPSAPEEKPKAKPKSSAKSKSSASSSASSSKSTTRKRKPSSK